MKKSLLLTNLLLFTITCFSQSVEMVHTTFSGNNGTYTKTGTSNGKNLYEKNATTKVEWSTANSRWEWIEYSMGTFIIAFNTTDTDEPPCSSCGTCNSWQNPSGGSTTVTGDCATSAPAPIELISFNIQIQDKIAHLIWESASEINNEGFNIEHSLDNRTWETIGFVAGEGTTFEKQNYSFNHNEPARGVNFYRLKQMDYDGNFEYSNVISIDLANGGHQLTISPNPTSTGQFTINFSDSNFESGELEIYDSVGRMVRTQNISIHNTEIQTEDLPKGIYLVNLEVDGQRFLERVIIQ